MSLTKKETACYPWVFWFSLSIRRKWFSYWWKTRGSNFVEYQIWVFKISIGRPWLKSAVESKQFDYGSGKALHKTNQQNLKQRFSFLIRPKIKYNTRSTQQ